jgi:hypothetical protein
MSVTLTRVPDGEDVWGRTRVTMFDVALDTSYPLTGGYVINAQDVGLKAFKGVDIVGSNKAGGAVLPIFDLTSLTSPGQLPTSLALRLFLPSGGATAPATLTAPVGGTAGAITVAGTATGTIPAGGTTVTSTAANGAIVSVPGTGLTASQATGGAVVAGIGKEVGNTTDVSTLIYRVRFLGF